MFLIFHLLAKMLKIYILDEIPSSICRQLRGYRQNDTIHPILSKYGCCRKIRGCMDFAKNVCARQGVTLPSPPSPAQPPLARSCSGAILKCLAKMSG